MAVIVIMSQIAHLDFTGISLVQVYLGFDNGGLQHVFHIACPFLVMRRSLVRVHSLIISKVTIIGCLVVPLYHQKGSIIWRTIYR